MKGDICLFIYTCKLLLSASGEGFFSGEIAHEDHKPVQIHMHGHDELDLMVHGYVDYRKSHGGQESESGESIAVICGRGRVLWGT